MTLNNHQSFTKNFKFSIFKLPLLILLISCLLQISNSQEISEVYEKALIEYNKTKTYLEDLTKKMKDITMNIVLRIRFREIKRVYNNIEIKIKEIQEELNKDKYDKEKIIENIKTLNENIKKFNIKYKTANNLYYEFEKLKISFLNFVKLFFIILLIVVIVVLSIIGIASFFVIKSQRKYYILKEEISLHDEQNIKKSINHEKITPLDSNNNLNKESTEDLTENNSKIKKKVHQSTSATSRDSFTKKK